MNAQLSLNSSQEVELRSSTIGTNTNRIGKNSTRGGIAAHPTINLATILIVSQFIPIAPIISKGLSPKRGAPLWNAPLIDT